MIVFIIKYEHEKSFKRTLIFFYVIAIVSRLSHYLCPNFDLEPRRDIEVSYCVIQWNFQATFWLDNFRVVEIFHFLAFIK